MGSRKRGSWAQNSSSESQGTYPLARHGQMTTRPDIRGQMWNANSVTNSFSLDLGSDVWHWVSYLLSSSLRESFLAWACLTFEAGYLGCPGPRRVFSYIPGLYSAIASPPHPYPALHSHDNQKCLWALCNVPWGLSCQPSPPSSRAVDMAGISPSQYPLWVYHWWRSLTMIHHEVWRVPFTVTQGGIVEFLET